MKAILPKLTVAIAVLAVCASAQQPPAAATAYPAASSGQAMMHQVARQLHQQTSVSAKVRHRVNLLGRQLNGAGQYLQWGAGDEKLLRLELAIQVGEASTSLKQVCDGRFLWIHYNLPDGANVQRVDLRRVRKAATQAAPARPASGDHWIALGGLPKLLDSLAASFQFDPPQPSQIQDVPVWRLQGRWKTEALANLLPEQADALHAAEPPDWSVLPECMPHLVEAVVGRDDLFPYSIDYRRYLPVADDARRAAGAASESIVAMELYEVTLGGRIDTRQFNHAPPQVEVIDVTDQYLAKMGLLEAP